MSLSRSLIYTSFVSTVLSLQLGTSSRNSGTAVGLGQLNELTTIGSDVTAWLSGLGTHNIYGNLKNDGNLVISQTDWTASTPGGQTSDWTGSVDGKNGVLVNNGNILLNDVSALSAPTYDWIIQTVQNEGTIQWCGRGDTGGSTYHLSTTGDLVNDGLIVFEQVYGHLGTAMTFQNTYPTTSTTQAKSNVYNNGGFLIRKARVDIMQQILGNGCWMIDDDAVLYLQDGLGAFNNYGYKPSLAGQSISFTGGSSGTLHMDTAVYSHNPTFGATVYGFSTGHIIEFYEIIKSISYDSGKGVLTVRFNSANHVDITIGTGYDASKFSYSAHLSFYANFNAVFYSGPAPGQTAPSQCSLTADTCGPLTGTPPPASTTSTLSTSVVPRSSAVTSLISSPASTVTVTTTATGQVSTVTASGQTSTVTVTAVSTQQASTVTASGQTSTVTITAVSTQQASTVTASGKVSTITVTAVSTQQASTITASGQISTITVTAVSTQTGSTVTASGSTSTVTVTTVSTQSASSVTVTPQASTVTVISTATQPAGTLTVTNVSTKQPSTVTVTANQQPSTVTITSTATSKASTVTVTSVQSQPAGTVTITSTETQPVTTTTITSAVTLPASTTTVTSGITQPASTVTITSAVTKPASTVTKAASTITVTSTTTADCTQTWGSSYGDYSKN